MEVQIPIWAYWLMGAIVLALLELSFSGAVLLCFSFASFVTTFVCLFGAGVEIQVLSFIVFTVVAFVTVRPLFLRHMQAKKSPVETNTYALINAEARVTEEIDPATGAGRVKIRGEEWSALGKGQSKIPPGTRVRVLEVSGNKVIVKPLE